MKTNLIISALALSLITGCGTINRLNPFSGSSKKTPAATTNIIAQPAPAQTSDPVALANTGTQSPRIAASATTMPWPCMLVNVATSPITIKVTPGVFNQYRGTLTGVLQPGETTVSLPPSEDDYRYAWTMDGASPSSGYGTIKVDSQPINIYIVEGRARGFHAVTFLPAKPD